MPIKLAFSYSGSESDAKYLDDILKSLTLLKRLYKVEVWSREMIAPGEYIEKEINVHFFNADIILLLISRDYFNESQEHVTLEMQMAQSNQLKGYSKIIPIRISQIGGYEDYLYNFFGDIKYFPGSDWIENSEKEPNYYYGKLFDELEEILKVFKPVPRQAITIFSKNDLIRDLKRRFNNHFEDFVEQKSSSFLTVIKANDKWLNRNVIIKAINPWLSPAEEDIKNQLTEAKSEISAFSNYRHRNIKTVYSGKLSEELNYVILEYVNGNSLGEIIKREGKQPIWEVKQILLYLFDALYYGHKRGLVHNYVNPSNIYIDDEFVPIISPFRMLNTSHFIGEWQRENLMYWSPEMVKKNKNITEKSDQFSLGLIGYELITGEPLFSGKSEEIVKAKRENHWGNINGMVNNLLESGCPNQLIKIITKLTCFNEEDRYKNLWEAITELEKVQISLNDETKIVLDSYRRSSVAAPNLIEAFYEDFFRGIPNVKKKYFSDTTWEEQYFKVHHSINALLHLGSNQNENTLANVALNHQKRRIPMKLYEKFGKSLVKVVSRWDREWEINSEIETSWHKLISKGIKFMAKEKK